MREIFDQIYRLWQRLLSWIRGFLPRPAAANPGRGLVKFGGYPARVQGITTVGVQLTFSSQHSPNNHRKVKRRRNRH